MNAWIDTITELLDVGRNGFSFSFSDAGHLLPDVRICGILVLCVAYLMFSAWEDMRPEDKNDHESDADQR